MGFISSRLFVYSCLEANTIKDISVSKPIGYKMCTLLFLRNSRDLLAISDFWFLSSRRMQHWLAKVWGSSCPIAWLDIHLSSGDKIAQEGLNWSALCSFLLLFYHIALFALFWNMFHGLGHYLLSLFFLHFGVVSFFLFWFGFCLFFICLFWFGLFFLFRRLSMIEAH